MKPSVYTQPRKRDEARLTVRRTSGAYFEAHLRNSKGQINRVALKQREINNLAAFLDHWRTDLVHHNKLPTDYQVDCWAWAKMQELKRKGQSK